MLTNSVYSRVAKIILTLWLSILALTAWLKIGTLSLIVLALTGALPFILIILWLSLSNNGKRILGWFELWHLRAFAVSALFAYGIYGQKWAGDTINELFNLDAKYFGLTSAVLTVLFTPFGLLYRPEVISSVFTLFIFLAILVIPVYVLYLLFAEGVKTIISKIVSLIIAVFVTAIILGFAFNIAKAFKPAVMTFAIWADFNEKHLCTDSWVAEAKSVVFLDDGQVLGYFPSANGDHFKVGPCNYSKKI